MSFYYGPPKDEKEMIALISCSCGRGVNFFDTAGDYRPIIKEDRVGKALVPFHASALKIEGNYNR